MQWKETKTPEIKPFKNKAELQKEYMDLCSAAGDKQFQVTKLQAELYIINEQLFKLQEDFKSVETLK